MSDTLSGTPDFSVEAFTHSPMSNTAIHLPHFFGLPYLLGGLNGPRLKTCFLPHPRGQ